MGRSSSPGRVKNFLFSTSSRLALAPTQPPIQWVLGAFSPRGKAAREWSWPLTSNYCRGQENVNLYIYFPIRLHGVVLNWLSTGTTSPFLQVHRQHSQYKDWLRADDQGIRVQVQEGEGFSPLVIQTGSGAHPASYPMGTRGFFLRGVGGKTAGAWSWQPLIPTSAEAKKMWIYTFTPPYVFMV
jgi:hypothetical protein